MYNLIHSQIVTRYICEIPVPSGSSFLTGSRSQGDHYWCPWKLHTKYEHCTLCTQQKLKAMLVWAQINSAKPICPRSFSKKKKNQIPGIFLFTFQDHINNMNMYICTGVGEHVSIMAPGETTKDLMHLPPQPTWFVFIYHLMSCYNIHNLEKKNNDNIYLYVQNQTEFSWCFLKYKTWFSCIYMNWILMKAWKNTFKKVCLCILLKKHAWYNNGK